MGSKKKGVCLPYANLITKTLEHTRFNFEEDEFAEDVTKIGETVLATMRYEIIDGNLIENTSNEKKSKMDDQEAPLDVEDFDSDIPQLPSYEDILKVIIMKLDTTNDEIDFITRHFI